MVSTTIPVVPQIYAPERVETEIDGNKYVITMFSNVFDLKDHVVKHVLDPLEAWTQLDPTLNIQKTRTDLLTIDCYSHYVGSPHNNWCKWCPHLSSFDCETFLQPAITLYTSTITSVVTFQGHDRICYMDPDGKLVFLDDSAVTIYCSPLPSLYEYEVETAFRPRLRIASHLKSREVYLDKAREKFFLKRSSGSRPLVLRI
jgi:hypothetical protein